MGGYSKGRERIKWKSETVARPVGGAVELALRAAGFGLRREMKGSS